MSKLFLEPTEDSPRVLFDSTTGILTIQGRSFMEDTSPFYFGILEWLREYFKQPQSHTVLKLEFDYINSASYRMVADILGELNKYYVMGNSVEAFWCFYPDDESLAEMGQELDDMFDFKVTSKTLVH